MLSFLLLTWITAGVLNVIITGFVWYGHTTNKSKDKPYISDAAWQISVVFNFLLGLVGTVWIFYHIIKEL